MDLNFKLQLIGSLLWTITYVLIIIKGYKDKTYGMPFLALCLNLAFEFIFAFIFKTTVFHQIICFIWFILDVFIFITFMKYGYKDFKRRFNMNKLCFYVTTLFSLASAFILIYISSVDFKLLFNDDIFLSGAFVAFFQNLVMSILFVFMLYDRKSLDGQCIFIAIFKFVGTLLMGLTKFLGFMPTNATELFVIFLTIVFDILYVILVFKYSKKIKK